MCDLYSITKLQAAIRQLAKAMVDTSRNRLMIQNSPDPVIVRRRRKALSK
jgi:hypothetical protein